eukprot:scaffold5834_cov107-Isochrysis_galbana.AAC.3
MATMRLYATGRLIILPEEAERRISEEPLLALAKHLGFAAVNDEHMSTKAFGAFVKRNAQQGASRRTRCRHEERQARFFGAAHCGPATCTGGDRVGVSTAPHAQMPMPPPPASPAATATVVAVHTPHRASRHCVASPVPAAVPLAPVAVRALLSSRIMRHQWSRNSK